MDWSRIARLSRPAVGLVVPFFFGMATAQTIDLTTSVVPLAPGITVSLVRQESTNPDGSCIGDDLWECNNGTQQVIAVSGGTDAVGNIYFLHGGNSSDGRDGAYLRRLASSGLEDIVANLILDICNSDCAIGLGGVETRFSFSNQRFDVVNGDLLLAVFGMHRDAFTSQFSDWTAGIVRIGGLPTLFDTLLTFAPGGQLAALMPAHPDGFRSADSIQIWTGDVRSMRDWSLAKPLTCEAATNPAPGQVVTVADTLADPALDHGRYYITASVNGTDRRLGRQYVDGAFSARNPATLPVCAP
jgi:hypothetical protein